MSGKYVIAEGTHGDGLTWVIWARRHEPHEGDLLSMIRITDATGRILHGGGRAGPPAASRTRAQRLLRRQLRGTARPDGTGRPPCAQAGAEGPGRDGFRCAALRLPGHSGGAVRLAAPAQGRDTGVGDRVRR